MILRVTTVMECWCPKCSSGQMAQILDKSFNGAIPPKALVGKTLVCSNCKAENKIEDVLWLIPESFMVSSSRDNSEPKSNSELANWLNVRGYEE